ncbi:hypothetical protein ACRN9V_16210 [Shewanella baltica]|uniref:hypothetical protein n=1 Tax=Shewanella baltica TaxID=62322 RepID=UPI003D7AD64F
MKVKQVPILSQFCQSGCLTHAVPVGFCHALPMPLSALDFIPNKLYSGDVFLKSLLIKTYATVVHLESLHWIFRL